MTDFIRQNQHLTYKVGPHTEKTHNIGIQMKRKGLTKKYFSFVRVELTIQVNIEVSLNVLKSNGLKCIAMH